MKKTLSLYLFLTFLISVVLTGLIFIVWYKSQTMGFEEKQGMGILFSFLAIGQNLAITIFTLPILFQIDSTNYLNRKTKYLYLTASPIMTSIILYFFYLKELGGASSFAFLVPAVLFGLINSLFYNRIKHIFKK